MAAKRDEIVGVLKDVNLALHQAVLDRIHVDVDNDDDEGYDDDDDDEGDDDDDDDDDDE